ncbi:hypothetical protein [Methylobacterium sp. Leaf118]|uniref:hypothetical protein n=1 Tax=Methylobacterium sp. Leaf118 TaxID=2876562 RepID=UPI001E328BF8|nr:hypothetical protein [Methylobacterium sp. Leaf118]
MRRPALTLALAATLLVALTAQSSYEQWHTPEGKGIIGQVIYCSTGKPREAAPCGSLAAPMNILSAPFRRLHSAPIRLKALGTTPKVFPISRPADATTYRVVVPCNVNIRLLGATSANEVLTDDNGVLYLAGTDVTMGTSKPDFIIAKTTAEPTGDCTPEMHYGMGGG